jgi:hypothetical protein
MVARQRRQGEPVAMPGLDADLFRATEDAARATCNSLIWGVSGCDEHLLANRAAASVSVKAVGDDRNYLRQSSSGLRSEMRADPALVRAYLGEHERVT